MESEKDGVRALGSAEELKARQKRTIDSLSIDLIDFLL